MDTMIKGMLCDNTVNFVAISGRELVERAREIHGLSRVCTSALGRVLMQSCMMSAGLKSESDRLTAILSGGGMAGNIVCTARPNAIVKGYIENPAIELPLAPNGTLDVPLAVGWFGDLTVIRDLSLREPYIGKTKIISGEIAEDFANYYVTSEQQPCMIYLGVTVDADSGECRSAAGSMIMPLPNCPIEVIERLESVANDVSGLAKLLETHTLKEGLEAVFGTMGMELTGELTPRFECDCSRERLLGVLMTLGEKELASMIEEQGGAEMECRFCNTKYRFTSAELETLIKEIKAYEVKNAEGN